MSSFSVTVWRSERFTRFGRFRVPFELVLVNGPNTVVPSMFWSTSERQPRPICVPFQGLKVTPAVKPKPQPSACVMPTPPGNGVIGGPGKRAVWRAVAYWICTPKPIDHISLNL